jgi:tetratricopeptide (TPR) repeat protein
MTRDDWCRRTTWTPRDQAEFFARNSRSRGADSKAQYMRIQARTLLETGDPGLAQSALELFELALADHPTAMDRVWALEGAGECCERLGRAEDAADYYRQALERQQEFPGMGTSAGYLLARLAVEQDRPDLYAEALAAAELHGDPVFPWQAYILNGIRAVVAHRAGAPDLARTLANAALEAAAVSDTGLGHGRGHLGTVKDVSTRFRSVLQELRDA